MIKKTRININTNFLIYVRSITNFLNFSSKKKKFLESLKKFLNTDNLLLCAQGRVAAYNIFKIIINDNKNEILISPYTLTEVINAIIYAGGKPIYVDIDINTGLPDHNKVNELINNKTSGIIITHLYSNASDILNFKEKFNNKIKIIEDTAINLGAKVNNEKFLGTLFDYGFYSFGVMKNLCTFHGGAIFCKEKNELDKIELNLKKNIKYPVFAALKLIFFCMIIDLFYSKYIFNFFTYYLLKIVNKYKISYIEKIIYPGVYPKLLNNKPKNYTYNFNDNFSEVGIINIGLLEERAKLRINNVTIYEKNISQNLLINKFKDHYNNSFLEYPILLKKNKNKFVSSILFKNGYDVRHTWYINSAKYQILNYSIDQFPNCDLLNDYLISLPTNKNFKEKDIHKICNIINELEK